MSEVALKEHLERLIHEHDRRYEQRFEAMDVALGKAESSLREYKLGSNEWRDALKDANARMAPRVDVEKIDSMVRDLQGAKANLEGRLAVISAITAAVVSGVFWIFGK